VLTGRPSPGGHRRAPRPRPLAAAVTPQQLLDQGGRCIGRSQAQRPGHHGRTGATGGVAAQLAARALERGVGDDGHRAARRQRVIVLWARQRGAGQRRRGGAPLVQCGGQRAGRHVPVTSRRMRWSLEGSNAQGTRLALPRPPSTCAPLTARATRHRVGTARTEQREACGEGARARGVDGAAEPGRAQAKPRAAHIQHRPIGDLRRPAWGDARAQHFSASTDFSIGRSQCKRPPKRRRRVERGLHPVLRPSTHPASLPCPLPPRLPTACWPLGCLVCGGRSAWIVLRHATAARKRRAVFRTRLGSRAGPHPRLPCPQRTCDWGGVGAGSAHSPLANAEHGASIRGRGEQGASIGRAHRRCHSPQPRAVELAVLDHSPRLLAPHSDSGPVEADAHWPRPLRLNIS
jgi:hypothetical protein